MHACEVATQGLTGQVRATSCQVPSSRHTVDHAGTVSGETNKGETVGNSPDPDAENGESGPKTKVVAPKRTDKGWPVEVLSVYKEYTAWTCQFDLVVEGEPYKYVLKWDTHDLDGYWYQDGKPVEAPGDLESFTDLHEFADTRGQWSFEWFMVQYAVGEGHHTFE